MQRNRKTVLIDYGIGNLHSMQKALEAVGADVVRSGEPDDILGAARLVLPGVGAFGSCARALRDAGLEEPVLAAVARSVPLLGVCVGMQLLFEEGFEKGRHRGLGLLPGSVRRFPDSVAREAKVPHVGWNRIRPASDHALVASLPATAWVYFVHSYIAMPENETDVIASAYYGVDFPAMVGRNRVFGVQFHPEKSRSAGLSVLRNYVRLID